MCVYIYIYIYTYTYTYTHTCIHRAADGSDSLGLSGVNSLTKPGMPGEPERLLLFCCFVVCRLCLWLIDIIV